MKEVPIGDGSSSLDRPTAWYEWPSIFSVMRLTRKPKKETSGGEGGSEAGIGKGETPPPPGSPRDALSVKEAEEEEEEWVYHGVAVGVRRTSSITACGPPQDGNSGEGMWSNALALSSSSSRGSSGVLFAMLRLKSREEQKEWCHLPEHKRHGEVLDSREFAALTQWLLSKAM